MQQNNTMRMYRTHKNKCFFARYRNRYPWTRYPEFPNEATFLGVF